MIKTSETKVDLIEITGIETLRERIPGADMDVVQLHKGAIGGQLLHVSGPDCVLAFGSLDQGIRSRGVMPSGFILLGTVLAQAEPVIYCGQKVAIGDIGIAAPGCETDCLIPSGMEFFAVGLEQNEALTFANVVEPEIRHLLEGSQYKLVSHRPGHHLIPALARHAKGKVLGQHEAPSAGFDPGLLARSAFHKLITSFNAHGTDRVCAPGFDRKLVQQAEDLARVPEENASDIADYCLQLGVSRRTLERAFHRTLNVSPKQYLTQLKLCAAREDLVKGHQSITEVAARHGFFELGRFAAKYRQIFDELPSTTIRMRKSAL